MATPVFSWAAVGRTATPAASDHTGLVITSGSYVNVFDQTITARTATSPGSVSLAYKCGVGRDDMEYGNKVKVQCSVLATKTAGDDGYVKFIGPDHIASNEVELTIAGGSGPSWSGYGSSSFIYLNSDSNYDDTDTSRNKIDVHAKVDGGTLYIYGIRCYIVYD